MFDCHWRIDEFCRLRRRWYSRRRTNGFGNDQIQSVTHYEEGNEMHEITVTRVINVPKDRVWAMLADYDNIHKYVSSVKYSEHVDGPQTGPGAVRRCDVMMGMKLFEEVVEWEEGRSYTVNIRSYMPTSQHFATLAVKETAPNQTELSMVMRYGMKGGVFGTAMNAVMMRSVMKRNMNGMLKDVDKYVGSGVSVERTSSLVAR